MAKQIEITTKDNILRIAARLFAEKGYRGVTMREIAKTANITAASIYYHFPSKENILKNLYKFYSEQRRKEYPDLNRLLVLAETEAPHKVLMMTEFHFNEEIREMLSQIIVTATRIISVDPESKSFIQENIFDSITNILKPLLERMLELGRIKPLNVDAFLNVLSFYCFSAAALNYSPFRQEVAEYRAGMSFIYKSIVPAREKI